MSVHEIVRQSEAGKEALEILGLSHPRELLAGGFGETVRQTAHRKTERLLLPNGQCCYLKLYLMGAAKIGKVAKRRAAAAVEWEAAERLRAAGIPVPGFLSAIWSSAGDQAASAVLIEAVQPGRPLDLLLEGEAQEHSDQGLLSAEREAWLGRALTPLVARLHGNGFQHRDLYACHFLEGRDAPLVLIDLARVRQSRRLSQRRRVKDLAALHYSLSRYLRAPLLLRLFLGYSGLDHCVHSRLEKRERRLLRRILRKSRRISQHKPRYD